MKKKAPERFVAQLSKEHGWHVVDRGSGRVITLPKGTKARDARLHAKTWNEALALTERVERGRA